MFQNNLDAVKLNTSENNSSKILEKCCYDWTINAFKQVTNARGFNLKSSIFPLTEASYQWQLDFYPNGVERYLDGNVAVVLHSSYQVDCIPYAEFQISIRNSDDEEICKSGTENDCSELTDGWKYTSLIKRKELEHYVADDILKIYAIIWTEVFQLKPTHEMVFKEKIHPVMKLTSDLESMLQNEKFSDFILKVEDLDIPVHRVILAARSPVFSAMFEHDTLERNNGYLKVTDLDKDTMILLVKFIYTGTVGDLSNEKAIKLLYACDKYNLFDLKIQCANYLKENLKMSNVVNILMLADFYDVPELKENAFKYIWKNIAKFTDIQKFQTLVETAPNLLAELISKIALIHYENLEPVGSIII